MFAARQGFFAQQGPGINVITDGLSLYLNAGFTDSYPGSGTAWNDISGNARNFTWNTTPTFGLDGTVPYLRTQGNLCTGPASNSFGINNTSGYTLTLVLRQITLTEAGAFVFTTAGSGTSSRGIFSHLAWTDGVVYFDQGGGFSGTSRRTNVASGGTNAWNVWTLRRLTNSSSRSIWKNASLLTTNNTTAENINLDSRAACVGGSSQEYGGTSSTWNAYLYAYVVYNRGLSDAEVIANSNSIRSTLGI